MSNLRPGAVLWKGNPTDLAGPEIKQGDSAPVAFNLVANDMSAVSGADLSGKKRILSALPSIDTPICDTETRRFNQEAASIPGVEVVTVSMDLPFAQKRWCAAAGIDRVRTLSDYRERSFGTAYGVFSPAKGLLARAVFVIGSDDKVAYVEYVKEVGSEPDYKKAIDAARGLK